ncbi:universal stress protein [Pseudomonas vanderleydeniana]|uniref:Universal stress protein n=1 Tax=Pseudomonas vanderleydeniana TaxID=2745495 RepID=A0A9E6PGK1_9PSED|nr:universal stress protein [Pseudomonas vanderleydeniana]QXI25666.1 universal stress protein [Pseudomonas vanderleydeniana]
MGQYRQLLVLLDELDPHSVALRRGLALAQASGASVHVLGVFKPGVQYLLRESRLEEIEITLQRARYQEQLKGLVERNRRSGVRLTADSVESSEQVVDYLAEVQPDMVIKESEEPSALARLFGTPTDCALMRGFQGIKHFVPARAVALPRRILVAVDTEPGESPEAQGLFNQALIRAAQALALQCNGQLHLLSAYSLAAVFAADMAVTQAWIEEMRDTLKAPFDALATAEGVPPECRHFEEGTPVQVIREQVAALDIDVVVMGVVQPRGLDKLLGDTTERIVGQPPCSVLAVSPRVIETWAPQP